MKMDLPSLSESVPTVCHNVAKIYCPLQSTVYRLYTIHANLDICLLSNYIKEVETWLHIR